MRTREQSSATASLPLRHTTSFPHGNSAVADDLRFSPPCLAHLSAVDPGFVIFRHVSFGLVTFGGRYVCFYYVRLVRFLSPSFHVFTLRFISLSSVSFPSYPFRHLPHTIPPFLVAPYFLSSHFTTHTSLSPYIPSIHSPSASSLWRLH